MKVKKLLNSDVYLIERSSFRDERGEFTRLFCEQAFADNGLPTRFPHINFSENPCQGTLRGMHYQTAPHEEGKLIICLSGSVFDVGVDMRGGSKSYGHWVGCTLSAEEKNSLYVPPGFAHGFLTLEPNSKILYLSTVPYAEGFERGLRYNDPAIGIEWPMEPKVISEKDKSWADVRLKAGGAT